MFSGTMIFAEVVDKFRAAVSGQLHKKVEWYTVFVATVIQTSETCSEYCKGIWINVSAEF